MAVIYQTTLVPSKLDLLTPWLPKQGWYVGPESPQLSKAGGFRLDDPAGEVGLEVMIVNAIGATETCTYLVPMTYRGVRLPDRDSALIGTSTHGVLGQRWIYDAEADPVFQAELVRLVSGQTSPQHQSHSDEVDDRVVVRRPDPAMTMPRPRLCRFLTPGIEVGASGVIAMWIAPDGAEVMGLVVEL